MSEIKNIDDLRNHAISTLKKLEEKQITIQEAGVTSKLYENIISSVKTEIDYHKMLEKVPSLPFLEGYERNVLVIEPNKDESKLIK